MCNCVASEKRAVICMPMCSSDNNDCNKDTDAHTATVKSVSNARQHMGWSVSGLFFPRLQAPDQCQKNAYTAHKYKHTRLNWLVTSIFCRQKEEGGEGEKQNLKGKEMTLVVRWHNSASIP